MVTVSVPATSANIGPGFDCLGLAIGGMNNTFGFEPWEGLEILSQDGMQIPTGESNLVYQAAKTLYDLMGEPLKGLRISQTSPIPLARGLGSSSACIVGGLVGANQLLGEPLDRQQLLDLATRLEGHPDNVAPALLGGLVTAVFEEGRVWYTKTVLKEDLSLVLVIPDFPLETKVAREALPGGVSHKDACYNLARAALMTQSLASGAYENLRVAAGDRLHQPYRFPLIPMGQEVIDQCQRLGGYAGMISGAGPTLLFLVDGGKSSVFVEGMKGYLAGHGLGGWRVEGLHPDNQGAMVLQEKQ